ncbi:MAG: class I SAM-dependent methyltransferase [Rhizobacter sp.]|nr:class I SAM-dependent methyltransferase [Chlorobiales bacterium]
MSTPNSPNAATRFSNRVENYVKFRPSYPEAVVTVLTRECGLQPDFIVADAGSGTGISAEIFLKHGCTVCGVEPNKEMREAAERLLAAYPNFKSIDANAEQTSLPSESADLVVAAQAFHWFDAAMAQKEFHRILKPNGYVVLMWNDRNITATPFLAAYDRFLHDCGTDYAAVNHKNIDDEKLKSFFAAGYKTIALENVQTFGYDGLKGRVLSSSYMPGSESHPKYAEMISALEHLFAAHTENGTVTLHYDTKLYIGKI